MDRESEARIRAHIKKKIRFTAKTTVSGIEKFDPENENHRKKVIDRIIAMADDVYGGSGPSLRSHRHLDDSWTVCYTHTPGHTAGKHYISPIAALSPFNSSA